MKHKIEWLLLRGSIGVFLVCLILSGILLAASFLFRDKMQNEYTQYQTHFRDVTKKYLSVDGDERIIKDNYPRFIELYNRGVIGPENRLSWVETLEAAGHKIKLPTLRYQIDSRQVFKPEFELDTGNYNLYATKMNLSLGLLHEIDLAKLFNELNQQASGLFNVKRCHFNKTDQTIDTDTDPEKPNIIAECELQWYSLNLSSDQEIKL